VSDLAAAASLAVDCLGVQAGERVAVISNPAQERIAAALAEAARDRGAEVAATEFAPLSRNGVEPPDEVTAAMARADALLLATATSLSHTRARRAACERGARVASLPTVTEEVFARALPVDYARMSVAGAELARRLSAASTCRLSSPLGTELTLSLEGRGGRNDDGDLRAPGAFGNLPAGEGYIAPREDAGTGTLVVDGSLAGWGLLGEPLELRLEDGALRSASGPAGEWLLETLDAGGPEGRLVAELGIGTNPSAQICGVILEDEKVCGTAHVAFGSSAGIGGAIQTSVHIDAVLLGPRVEIDGVAVADGGELLVGR
jgi:leucyl aminopeptidase (aminopeptidase T)